MSQRRGGQTRPLRLGADDLFNRTLEEFNLALADHERANFSQCASIEELLADIKALESFTRSRRRTSASLAKIKAFGDNLAPFFKIMEIVCGAHPEWANVALGALRLILQLASHFISFFEKLCSVVDAINARLPRYAELYERLAAYSKPTTPRLRMSLKQTYVALFEFFQAVARVFSNPRGKARGAAFVVADLMWKPFDLRFQNAIEKINFHQAIVKEELDIAAVSRIQDDIEALKEVQAEHATMRAQDEILAFMSRLAKSYDQQSTERYQASVIRWIDPPDFKENLSDAQEERTEGTAEWIFDDPIFMSWRNSRADSMSPLASSASLLWVNGKPGAGKTVLAGSIIEELGRGETVADSPPLTCYYFFSQNSGSKSTRIDAYRAIAAQLFHQCRRVPTIHDIYALATTEIATDTKASEQELVDLIRQCLSCVPNLYLVLDGVDECKSTAKLLRDMIDWCATSPVQIILLSRPDIAILRRSIEYRNTITLNQQRLADDISRYLSPELENMADESLLPVGADISKLVQHLVERAEGMFLWARVMVAYLSSPALMKQQRVKTIMEKNPSGLDRLEDLYSRIHKGIDSLDKPSKELAYKALLWVAHAQISTSELKEAIFADGWDVDSGDACADFEHAVIVSCRGFIEKKNSGVFKYIHLTARSFAQNGADTSTAQGLILPDEHIAKALIASRCVSYLNTKLPLKPLSGQLGINADANVLVNRCPLLKYAAWNWPNLSLDALDGFDVELSHPSMMEMFTQLNEYVENGLRIMVWVETLYTLSFEGLHAKLEGLLSRSQDLANTFHESRPLVRQFILEMNEMVGDIARLDTDWSSTLTAAPCEIWGDVTIFAKSRFLVPTKAGTLESLAPTLTLENGETKLKPLFSTSRSSPDSKRLAVLSVFPCRYFRDGWEKMTDIPFYPDRPEKRPKNIDRNLTPQDSNRPALPTTPEEVRDTCCGWTATYEILSVMTSKSESVLLITIPIDPLDVEICLRQSLWHSWSIFDGDLSTWLCSFTLSIGPRLDTFIILDNLTHLNSSSAQYTVKIPLNSHVRYNELWTRTRQFRRLINGYYTYQFTWSADGRHLALTDFDCLIAGRVPDGASIAVFSVIYGASGPLLEPLTSFHGSGLTKGMHGCQFHPSDNLLLFQDEANTYLWDFLDREMTPKAICFSDGLDSRKQYDEVSFSQCGRFLAVYSKGKPWPELRPIADFIKSRTIAKRRMSYSSHLVRTKRRKMINNDEESEEEDEEDEAIVFENDAKPANAKSGLVTYDGENVSLIAAPHTSVSSSAIVVSGGAELTLTSCKIASNMVEIHSKSSSEEARTPIVKLPQFIPTRGMSAQVAAPDQGDDPALYKIILNATPTRPYLSVIPSVAEYLPLIVRKDARSLKPVITPSAIAGPSSAHRLLAPADLQEDVMMLD